MCRVIAFYGYSYTETMRMPVRVFWLMAESISRIEAEHQRRALEVELCAQNSDQARDLAKRLQEQVGEVARRKREDPMSAKPDPEGLEWLRNS